MYDNYLLTGKWYIKMGIHSDHLDSMRPNPKEITDWCRSGSVIVSQDKKQAVLFKMMLKFLPGELITISVLYCNFLM